MTAETALSRIARICRENIGTFEPWESQRWQVPPIKPVRGEGALGEARGTVATCREILTEIRRLRLEAKKDRERRDK